MGKTTRFFALAVIALGAMGVWAGNGVAQESSPQKPPVSIEGYAYKYIPTGRVYSFICEVKACVPGSKVSYQLYPPDSGLDFEKYKLSQELIESYFKKNAPKGMSVKFGTPRRTENELYTAFENTREQKLPDGRTMFTQSMLLQLKGGSISLISSSRDSAVAEANRDAFLVGLLAWGQALNKDPE